MTTVAIISEYNPFHNGHKHQIEKIKDRFGEDTAIIAIMSGNYTQRAETAFCGKEIRAKCAALCGVNLVLELPFPYSASSAEIFADSGVEIAERLGVVDYLSFGAECADEEKIKACAQIMLSKEYKLLRDEIYEAQNVGYAEACERAYATLFPGDDPIQFTSNNILAIEYTKALLARNSNIKIYAVKREGSAYNDADLSDTSFSSASAIRRAYSDERLFGELSHALPEQVMQTLAVAERNGELPTDYEKLSTAIISHFRLNPPGSFEPYDATGGLYNRLYSASLEANSIHSLLEQSATKKYTNARIRRAILNSLLAVTSSDVKVPPRFTQVLAMDSIGMRLLKAIKKVSTFQVLTKPSAYDAFDEISVRQKRLSEKADAIFELTKPTPGSASSALRLTPYVKK
jgi:predicted nucleotidyltransferase